MSDVEDQNETSDSSEMERPTDYEFEPELRGRPPREIPEEFLNLPYHQNRMNVPWALFTGSAVCMALSMFPQVEQVGVFFSPFRYLFWIGVGLAVLAAISFFVVRQTLANLEYIRSGEAYPARILDLDIAPGMSFHGIVTYWKYMAQAAVWKDASAKPEIVDFVAEVLPFQRWRKKMGYRIGDLATAVRVPNFHYRPLQLYGFLGVRPDIGLIDTGSTLTLRQAFLIVVLIVLGLAFLVVVFGTATHFTLVGDKTVVEASGLIGAVVIGIPACILIERIRRRKYRSYLAALERAQETGEFVENHRSSGWFKYSLFLVLVMFTGGALPASTLMAVNIWFDQSKPEWRPVTVNGKFKESRALGISKNYFLTFMFPKNDVQNQVYCTPWHLDKFPKPPCPGFAEIHKGALGIAWLRSVEPEIPKEQ
jgi:hypothetical protein